MQLLSQVASYLQDIINPTWCHRGVHQELLPAFPTGQPALHRYIMNVRGMAAHHLYLVMACYYHYRITLRQQTHGCTNNLYICRNKTLILLKSTVIDWQHGIKYQIKYKISNRSSVCQVASYHSGQWKDD